ncbi:acyl-CoA synthetase [Cryptosporangium aurantiacum]|uniref:Acyl-CoA synthetase (AMP-forming)/AMP-acid ligase II n=1 Tax=Cryptosporangium aurantiacum TaxID=134849 RepID=A0A1M7PIU2_9ACTN|nr:acyl-CoA synthetase [Cryptosporangium aurantiacum]SHN16885.1 Acyl-CoA synthetase (AMP-forming)/AMP-acid ligase II [Cryptosporangium aurantiacum]
MRIGQNVDPGKTALIMGGGSRLDFADLEERSLAWARLFRAHQITEGDHIALLLVNSVAMFDVAWAAQRTGLYYTPVNYHLSADEAAHIVADCGATALIASAELAELATDVVARTPGLALTVLVDGAAPGFRTAADALAEIGDAPVEDQRDGTFMFYSSGTSGYPKGIVRQLSGEAFTGLTPMAPILSGLFGMTADTVYLSPGPLYHAAPLGWSMGVQGLGGTAVVMERFDAERALALIEEHRVTHAQFVPTMLRRMLALPDAVRGKYDLSSLKVVVHAAAPCPVELKRAVIDWLGPIVHEFYAGSEGTGFFVIDTPNWLAHPGSVGRPAIGTVHICDDDGTELAPGETGTIWFEGTPDFAYHNDPEKTAGAFNDRGWSTLGDLGTVDEEGYLYLTDRRGDLILSGGVNIYPQEVENAMSLHPAIADVAVIGAPDPDFGERVVAVVQLEPGATADADELITWTRDRLAHFKCPRVIAFTDELPRLPTGKLLRRRVREQFV